MHTKLLVRMTAKSIREQLEQSIRRDLQAGQRAGGR